MGQPFQYLTVEPDLFRLTVGGIFVSFFSFVSGIIHGVCSVISSFFHVVASFVHGITHLIGGIVHGISSIICSIFDAFAHRGVFGRCLLFSAASSKHEGSGTHDQELFHNVVPLLEVKNDRADHYHLSPMTKR